ncbi:MAG: endonuclease domain-containing protein [Verrucomicrobiaceae bacterium]
MEVPVPTKQPRHSGYPTCYKLDIGNRELMIAVEVDGKSHCSIERQAQDQKKEDLLQSLGWKVLRFTNAEVIRNLNGCVQEVRSSISK